MQDPVMSTYLVESPLHHAGLVEWTSPLMVFTENTVQAVSPANIARLLVVGSRDNDRIIQKRQILPDSLAKEVCVSDADRDCFDSQAAFSLSFMSPSLSVSGFGMKSG